MSWSHSPPRESPRIMNQLAPTPSLPSPSPIGTLAYYGLPLERAHARGVRLASPATDPCNDHYAQPLARGLARLCDERHPGAGVIAIDLFAGSGNVLHHLVRTCEPLAAIGYIRDELTHSLSVNNLWMLEDAQVNLRLGNYAALLRRDIAAYRGQDHAFLIHVALPAQGGPPLAEVLQTIRGCLAEERVLIAVLVNDDALRELGNNLELVACLGAECGALICTLRASSRTTGLTPAEYSAGFEEFLRRTPQTDHHLRLLGEQIDWKQVERVLSIGCGEAELELALAEGLPALELVCVEPNPGFADIAEAKVAARAPGRVQIVRERFETASLDSLGSFDLVVISHSLYYMDDQPEQLRRAFSCLRRGGELLVFHLHPEANLRAFQRRFGIHNNYSYCADDVARDLATSSLMYREVEVDIPTRIDDYPDVLSQFLMERRCTQAELAAVRSYFTEQFDAIWPNRSVLFRVPEDQSVAGLDEAAFARCFAAFCERSGEYASMRDRLERALEGRRSLLSIGCGDGRLELPCLRSSETLTRYRGLDPNGPELADFRAALARAPLELELDLVEAGLGEEPDTSQGEPESFELVLISHVLYYVEDKAAFMREALSRVAPGGRCLLFHQTNIGINSIQARFGSYNHRISSHEVQDLLDSLGVNYRVELLDANIDVRELPDELIHFFLERACTPAELTEVRAYFEAEVGEALYHPVCAFVIEDQGEQVEA